MRKVLKVFAGVLVGLALFGIQAGSVRANGEQSVKELIGRDGEYLIEQHIFQKVAPDDLEAQSEFGNSMAISGQQLFVSNNQDLGRVYIYELCGSGEWKEKQRIKVDGSQYFGSSIAISDNTGVIGARGSNAAYVFERIETGMWIQKQILTIDSDSFSSSGNSVSISGNFIIIGACDADYYGAAYIFERDDAGIWKQTYKLSAEKRVMLGRFGDSVAIDGNIAVVGFPGDDTKGYCSGSTVVFERNKTGVWSQKQKLMASDGAEMDNYGDMVLVVDDLILIGSPSDDDKGEGCGSVYLYQKNSTGSYIFKQKMVPNDTGGFFGISMAFTDENRILIGASRSNDMGNESGSLYIFEYDTNSGVWGQKNKLVPADGNLFDNFGESVAATGNLTIVGAIMDDYKGTNSGSIYCFNLNELTPLTEKFRIPCDEKYLVFKLAKNSTIYSENTLANKIRFEAVYFNRSATNPATIVEETFSVPLTLASYLDGFAHAYYIVDISELKAKYVGICKNKFKLGDGGTGQFIYESVGLRVRYDTPITVNNLKDVYVTDDATISEKDITFDIQPGYGSAEIKWTDVNPDWISGYQVIVKDTTVQPTNGISDPAPVKVPYISKTNLSAKKVYYVWVRPINILGVAGSWTSQQFSPKAEATTFDSIQSYPVSSFKDGILSYSIKLKVNEADAASYVIKRKLYNSSNDLEQLGEYSHDDVTTGFCDGGDQLQKHGKYEYYVYTKNALGELSGNFGTIVMNVKNIEPLPFEVPEPYKWRKTEVKKNLSLKLGPKNDPEGDPITYKLYIRTPGAQDERMIASRTPQKDNELLDVNYTFNDKTVYEWQIRCIDNPYGSVEVVNSGWVKTAIDTDAILVITKNILGISPSGTKKQPLNFEVEINPAKTYTGYQWDFGDGSAVVTGEKATHTYYSLNTYPVTVTAMEGNVQHKGGEDIAIVNTYEGRLFDNEDWSGLHGVKGEVVVAEGLTLTIMPGTEIQMQTEAGLKVAGTLKAVDTGANGGIKFDWQQDQNRWKGMRFEGSSVGDLRGVTICHAKTGILAEGDGLRLNLNSVTFDSNEVGIDYYSGTVAANQCNLLNNTQYGINVNGEVYPTNTYCIFKGNLINYKDSLGALSGTDVNELPGNMGNEFQ